MFCTHALSRPGRLLVGVLALLTVGGLGAFFAHELFHPGADGHLWDTWVYNAVIFGAAALVAARAVLVPGERGAWLMIAGALGLWVGGFVSYNLVIAERDPVPYPSIADGLWLGFYPFLLGGLVLLLRARRPAVRRGLWLDALIGTLAFGSVTAALLVDPIVASTGGSVRAVVVNLGYPLGDLLVVGFVLAVFLATGWRPGRVWVIIGAALSFEVVADTVYLQQAAAGTYEPGGWLGACWLVVAVALAAAAWTRPEPAASAVRPVSRWDAGVLFVFALIGLAVNSLDSVYALGPVALVLATATVLLAIVRATKTLAELAALNQGQELLARHASILDAAGEGVYGLDVEGRVTFANPAAARLSGHPREQLLGRVMHEVVHHSRDDGSPYPAPLCPITAALGTGRSATVSDEVYWRADGTSFPVDYTVTPMREGERVAGAVVVFRDVSERREVQQLKDQFISVVSHELRTPLTAIRGSLGLLAGGVLGQLPEKGLRMVDIAIANTDRLVRLINDMLDIERIESGVIAMDRRRCEVAALVEEAVEVMAPMARQAEVELQVQVEPAAVWADPDRLIQVLSNLVNNAIKFSPPGGQVRVSAARHGEEVLLRVADEGRGIPADKLEAIFGRFQQVDASDSRDKGGTGLGLAICRSILDQHGGRIWAESTPGRGATFTVAMPAVHTAQNTGAGPSVLVCDDDDMVLEVVAALLVEHGYRPLLTSSGEEALRVAARERPQAILLDLLMPGLSGWDTAAALARDPATADIPVIILSVLSRAETQAPTGGVVAWIDKPLQEHCLFATLEEVLARRPGAVSTILVVEDDADLGGLLCAGFERHGVRAVHASGVAAARELAHRERPDLVVLDLGLRDGSGFDVVEDLRRDQHLRTVPLVVYTAAELSAADRQRLRLGHTAFATKGRISPEEFEQQVIGLLDTVTTGREVADHVA